MNQQKLDKTQNPLPERVLQFSGGDRSSIKPLISYLSFFEQIKIA